MVSNPTRAEPVAEPEAEPVEAPIKPGFHQIRDTRVRQQPVYQKVEGKRYVTPHELTEDESYYVDSVVHGGLANAPEWDETNSMAQSREWNGDMVKVSNYNDYI